LSVEAGASRQGWRKILN